MITPSYHKILFIFMIFAFAAQKHFFTEFFTNSAYTCWTLELRTLSHFSLIFFIHFKMRKNVELYNTFTSV